MSGAAPYLEHVGAAVVGVLHHHHLHPRQSVGDAVLVFVADGLEEEEWEGEGDGGERRRRRAGVNTGCEGERATFSTHHRLHSIHTHTWLQVS